MDKPLCLLLLPLSFSAHLFFFPEHGHSQFGQNNFSSFYPFLRHTRPLTTKCFPLFPCPFKDIIHCLRKGDHSRFLQPRLNSSTPKLFRFFFFFCCERKTYMLQVTDISLPVNKETEGLLVITRMMIKIIRNPWRNFDHHVGITMKSS